MFNHTISYPSWFFVNDSLIIISSSIGIFVALLFILTVIRLDHPMYSISNLIGCHTCFAVALTNSAILINACYALMSSIRGYGSVDRYCYVRGMFFSVLSIYMNIAFCIKAINRFRCIVYNISQRTRSCQQFSIFVLIQWSIVIPLVLPILIGNSIEYDWGSNMCLITTNKPWQFIFFMSIYCVSIVLICTVYVYILYYVVHLPILERYRRKRQLALLRRIPILLLMIIAPGLIYLIILIRWRFLESNPTHIFKISALVESIGHTGAVLTIFISNSRLRRQYYRQEPSVKRSRNTEKLRQPSANCIPLKPRQKKVILNHGTSLGNEKFL